MNGHGVGRKRRAGLAGLRGLAAACLAAAALLALVGVAAAQKGGGYTFGALLPLTGPLAERGKTSKAALELAQADINAYLANNGQGGQVRFVMEDTGGKPATAVERLKALAGQGIRVVIGPYSDDDAEACLEYADKNNMVLISQGSSGPFLSRKGDNLFRLSPSDTYQAEAVTSLMRQEGVGTVVPLWRGDRYGDDMVVHVKARFRQLGGEVLPGARFAPDRKDFSEILGDLAKLVGQLSRERKNGKVAIYFAGGPEIVTLLKGAAKHPELAAVPWYGCDGTAMFDPIAKDPESAAFAMKVRLASPRYGEGGANVYALTEKRIQDKADLFPDTQSLAAYDGAWAAFFTAQAVGGTGDAARFKQMLPRVCERMYGVTGWLALNEHGDRREDWDFDFWVLGRDKDKYFWEKAARYQFEPGTAKELFLSSGKKK
ncbi:Extracellular ligand-binding receptor [Solidesulfovibrio fructosivorans JJ]]|uniref:Extracellular ligand-binding receptor n=1 Tax=Solidesulfovibrio fructosivorans JJ] TaxID=596151 RepID=E1JXH6_SOLFR|nr:ABC transporter substrate-binding protein [Solidesulfovibrio fructosivorans]EFL50953.1 Extracellular ligand-binding receptor [Solidesulfovibrio fructosivorans JJ]]